MLTQERLKQLLYYDPCTGEFTWLQSTGNRSPAGSKVINICRTSGYVKIGIWGTRYQAHRLVWLYIYGKFPNGDIDHINNIRHDNRLENLRECCRSENNYNRSPDKERPSNTGIKGITYNETWKRFDCGVKAQNKRARKSFYVKDFNSKEETLQKAKEWLFDVRQQLQGDFARF